MLLSRILGALHPKQQINLKYIHDILSHLKLIILIIGFRSSEVIDIKCSMDLCKLTGAQEVLYSQMLIKLSILFQAEFSN